MKKARLSRPVAPHELAVPPDPDVRDTRSPSQSRGQKRVDDILDAAEELIAEIGMDAINTNLIAERAGASVGSLYHFFPGKEQIVRALARRFAAQRNAIAVTPEAVHLPLDQLFKRAVMGQAALIHERPAFSAVYDTCCRDLQGLDEYQEMHAEVVGSVSRLLAARMPRLPRKQLDVAAQLSCNVVNLSLNDARTMTRERGTAYLREVQRMLVRYFEPLDAKYGIAAPPPGRVRGGGGRRPAGP